jgi:hypothetical protein
MSAELLEFSDMIDEQFNFTDLQLEDENFWELVINLFI